MKGKPDFEWRPSQQRPKKNDCCFVNHFTFCCVDNKLLRQFSAHLINFLTWENYKQSKLSM